MNIMIDNNELNWNDSPLNLDNSFTNWRSSSQYHQTLVHDNNNTLYVIGGNDNNRIYQVNVNNNLGEFNIYTNYTPLVGSAAGVSVT